MIAKISQHYVRNNKHNIYHGLITSWNLHLLGLQDEGDFISQTYVLLWLKNHSKIPFLHIFCIYLSMFQ